MKVRLTADDAFRVYICRDDQDWGIEVEVSEDLLQKFIAADKAFREVEDELHTLYAAARRKGN